MRSLRWYECCSLKEPRPLNLWAHRDYGERVCKCGATFKRLAANQVRCNPKCKGAKQAA